MSVLKNQMIKIDNKNQWNCLYIGPKDQKKLSVKILTKLLFGIVQGGLFKDLRLKS